MSDQTPLKDKSASFKKALLWVAEIMQNQPERDRFSVLQEAQLRFDLTPPECDFLSRHSGMPLEDCASSPEN